MQLFLGLHFGRGAHPVQRVDVLVHGLLDGQRHLQRLLLLRRRKVPRHVHLAQRLAQLAIHAAGAALPALLLLLRAVQRMRVEVPVLLVEALRQAGSGVGVQQVPAQIGPDLVDRRVGHQRVELGKELRLHVVGLARGGRMCRGHIIGQRKMRQLLAEAGHVGGVIQVLRVALLGNGERGLGQARLDGQHGLGVFGGLRLRLAGQHKDLVHVGHVLLPLLHALGVGAGVVVALRQAQPARAIEADHRCRVGKVLVRSHAEEGVHADGVQMRQQRGQIAPPSCSAAMRSSSGCSGASPSLFTAAVSMQLAYSSPIFCSFAVRVARRRGRLFENLLQVQPVQLEQLGKAAVAKSGRPAADCA